jgi:hypothetical protein
VALPGCGGGGRSAVSNIGAVARYGPPDDFHEQPTEHANWGLSGRPPHGEPPPTPPPADGPEQAEQPGAPGPFDPFEQEDEPTPWYRRPVMLVGWILLVAILVGLIIFGIVELIHGNQGAGTSPSTSTTGSTSSSTTTTTSTTPTTTPTSAPPTSSAAAPPPTYRPTQQPTQQPTQAPTHHHHLPHLPSVITIPEIPTVITLPPGLP